MYKPLALHLVFVGLVQGVGFRPFITRIALKHGLKDTLKTLVVAKSKYGLKETQSQSIIS